MPLLNRCPQSFSLDEKPEASSAKSVARRGTLSKTTDAAELASKHRCLLPSDINADGGHYYLGYNLLSRYFKTSGLPDFARLPLIDEILHHFSFHTGPTTPSKKTVAVDTPLQNDVFGYTRFNA
jgi:hypothetical protein